jgi:hypothetical protein
MKTFCLFFLLILNVSFLSAQSELKISSHIDWFTAQFQRDITAPIEEEPNQPTGRYKTEQYIARETPVITGQVLQDLRVDSTHMISSLITENPVLLRQLENLSQKMEKVFTTATADRKFLTVRYTFSIFPDLAELIIKHTKPYPSPVIPLYTSNEDFSGIIIYAAEKLPYQGNVEQQVLLNPCLFPRLYDSSMNLIHSVEMTEPEAVKKWGNAGYTYSFDLAESRERIGIYPLRTMASMVYGKNRTDLILPDEVVKKLISSEHNRNLLRQGRVVIILPPTE